MFRTFIVGTNNIPTCLQGQRLVSTRSEVDVIHPSPWNCEQAMRLLTKVVLLLSVWLRVGCAPRLSRTVDIPVHGWRKDSTN